MSSSRNARGVYRPSPDRATEASNAHPRCRGAARAGGHDRGMYGGGGSPPPGPWQRRGSSQGVGPPGEAGSGARGDACPLPGVSTEPGPRSRAPHRDAEPGQGRDRGQHPHAVAATDAICGLSLGKWSRGQDHKQAADLLGDVALRDTTLPTKLRRLLADKDAAHYSPNLITVDKATSMVRDATARLSEADAR